jgi:hypothetical protein
MWGEQAAGWLMANMNSIVVKKNTRKCPNITVNIKMHLYILINSAI